MNWVISLCRNGLEYTRAALPTLFAQDIGNVAVLFIDNDSTDGTGEFLRSQDGVLYSPQRPALSVAQSWNRSLRFLFEDADAPDYALVVNNDVELRPDTYGRLVADGGLFVTAVGHSDKNSIKPPHIAPDPAKKRPHPDFSCFLIRRECWDLVGPFDEAFTGAYCEDADYHLRMHNLGIKAEALEMPFYHAACGTIKSATPEERTAIMRRADSNRALFKDKWGVAVGSPEYYALFGTTSPDYDNPGSGSV